MASQPYQEILKRLKEIDSSEVWLLLGELQRRIKTEPKKSIFDFESGGPRRSGPDDWVLKLRKEWDDDGK